MSWYRQASNFPRRLSPLHTLQKGLIRPPLPPPPSQPILEIDRKAMFNHGCKLILLSPLRIPQIILSQATPRPSTLHFLKKVVNKYIQYNSQSNCPSILEGMESLNKKRIKNRSRFRNRLGWHIGRRPEWVGGTAERPRLGRSKLLGPHTAKRTSNAVHNWPNQAH